jgi:hypothetical protein
VATLARVFTAIIHISTTATIYIDRSNEEVLTDIREQIQSSLAQHHRGAGRSASTDTCGIEQDTPVVRRCG